MKTSQNFIRKYFKKNIDLPKIFTRIFFISILLVSNLTFADENQGVGHLRQCSEEGEVVDGFNGTFNPLGNNEQAKEYDFITSNPHCAAILSTYITAKAALQGALSACSVNKIVSPYPNLVKDAYYFGLCSKKAAASPDNKCKAALAFGTATYSNSFLAGIGIQYERAKNFYHRVSVCGNGWITSSSNPESKNALNITYSGYKETLFNKINDRAAQSNGKGCGDIEKGEGSKECREWFFNGMEYEDNPGDGSQPCLDPTSTAEDNKEKYQKQRYYLRGLLPGAFNCQKYKLAIPHYSGDKVKHLEEAYNCCRKRSEEYMCLQYSDCDTSQESCADRTDRVVFCKANSKCSIKNSVDSGVFSVKLKYENMLCAESYDFCPFNFSVGGGNESCDKYSDSYEQNGIRKNLTSVDLPEKTDFDPNTSDVSQYNNIDQDTASNCRSSEIRNPDCTLNYKAGKCRNYCQYLKHCTIIADNQGQIVGNYSPYMSRACINFIGDSKNTYDFNSGIVAGKLKNFSAPIAQCVKETIENLFFNRVGHSKCSISSEYPNQNEECENGYAKIESSADGGFLYHQKGGKVQNNSFFEKIQKSMKQIVLLVLSVSIMFFGAKVLAGMVDISKKKEIITYVLKIAFIMYFTMGNAWQSVFFNGVYSTSSELSSILFKMITPSDEKKRDGCQFGNLILNEDTQTIEFNAITDPYPKGKEYLAMWDTLDCKIAKYLGFGPTASVANIFLLILAGFFTGPIGIYFSLVLLIFGIYLIVITLKSLHIFLGSALAIILMVFVSPLIFLMMLFDKTKDAFKKWFMALISFCLQPLFLAAYIFIVLTTMDKLLIGSATFDDFGKNKNVKTINCQATCQHLSVENGRKLTKQDGDLYKQCLQYGDDYAIIKNPMEDSVACLVGFDQFGKVPGLEIIGLTIPIIVNLLSGDVGTKILHLLKAMLMIYLLNKFINEIPGISAALTGSKLDMMSMDGNSIFKKGGGAFASMQKRAVRALKGGAGKAGGAIANKARKKSRAGISVNEGGKHVASNSGAGSSSASSSRGVGSSATKTDGGNPAPG